MTIWDVTFDIEPMFKNIDLSLRSTAKTEKLLDYIEHSVEHFDDIAKYSSTIC